MKPHLRLHVHVGASTGQLYWLVRPAAERNVWQTSARMAIIQAQKTYPPAWYVVPPGTVTQV